MRQKSTIQDLFSGIWFSFSLLWEKERMLFLYICFTALLDTAKSFQIILFPKYLLDGLTQQNYSSTIKVIFVFTSLQFLFIYCENVLRLRKEMCSQRNQMTLNTLLIEKMAELRPNQMEKTENLKKYEFAKKCIEKGGAESYFASILSILSSVVVVAGVLYILKNLQSWIFIVLFMVIAINAVGNIVSAQYTYQEMTEETPTERNLYYFRGHIMNKEYAKEIRAFHIQNFISKKTIQYIQEFFNINQKYKKKHHHILWWIHVASGVQTFCLYFYNVSLFFRKTISIGSFSMNISAVFQFSTSMNEILSQSISMAEQNVYLKDYSDFLKLNSDFIGTNPISLDEKFTIEFDHVSFKYPGQTSYALKNVSIYIHSEEKISIVGQNGVGKTTFIKLLLGFYRPTNGVIRYNGENIENYDYKSYQNLFSAVMQDYQIYSFTILENLAFSTNLTSVDRERALEVLQKIGLKDTIENIPHNIDTYLTQRYDKEGIELSGGEYQKLVIARALYKNAKIIILDEPTSALSPQSEYEIYKRFQEITRQKTIFYISHRLSSCTLCDRVIVFEQGSITENGTHDELIKKNGLYAKMYQKQASLYGI